MGSYVATNLPTDGSTIDASDVTTDLNGLINEFNGSIDNTNIKAGAAIAFSKLAADAWTAHSATLGGFSGTPTQANYFLKIGRLVVLMVNIQGTSNATALTFTLPYAAARTENVNGIMVCTDNGTTTNDPPRIALVGTTTANAFKTLSGTTWTNANGKGLEGMMFYESAS